ncbi:Sodium:sulfate symporter transmembrane region family protein [Pelomyxa schiedti]|nr:Sodium:sulfate symporter transmembrane region family protein [Pelomyxa schiedti]
MADGDEDEEAEALEDQAPPLAPKLKAFRFSMVATKTKRIIKYASGLVGCLFLVIGPFFGIGGSKAISQGFTLTLVMALWWLFEPVPLFVTAFLPLVVIPMYGLMSGIAVCLTYMNNVVMLFIGGSLVAVAMERWSLHKRLALKIVLLVGARPRLLLLGFMGLSFFLSMWISNAATAMIMVPNALAIINEFEPYQNSPSSVVWARTLLMGIALSSSLGGCATLVGTQTNLVFAELYSSLYNEEVTFTEWLFFAFPMCIIICLLCWIWFSFVLVRPGAELMVLQLDVLYDMYAALGSLTFEEVVVSVDFCLLALGLLFRADIVLSAKFTIPGWASWFGVPSFITDSTVAIFVACILFFIPAHKKEKRTSENGEEPRDYHEEMSATGMGDMELEKGFVVLEVHPGSTKLQPTDDISAPKPLSWREASKLCSCRRPHLTWSDVNAFIHRGWNSTVLSSSCLHKVPWSVVVMFGGGFALAEAVFVSGFGEYLASKMTFVSSLSLFVLVLLLILVTCITTEFMTNVAVAQIFLPVVASIAAKIDVHPALLMVPTTLACSFSYLMPISCAPNMIIYLSNRVSTFQMIKLGFFTKVTSILLALGTVFLIMPWALSIDADTFPSSWLSSLSSYSSPSSPSSSLSLYT